jgi:hypothetical protein
MLAGSFVSYLYLRCNCFDKDICCLLSLELVIEGMVYDFLGIIHGT